MGVTGLWKLIEPCGKPVPVETLEGKILAIDISIWLHQVVKGFQDNKGAALNNAHLLGLFHRLCKLLYYRVKPVFVFDGCVPQLKKDTIARRQQQRSKLNSEAERIQALLLQSLAKEKIVQQALGANAELLITSPKKLGGAKASRKENTVDDMFKLPELPSSSKSGESNIEDYTIDEYLEENSYSSADNASTSATDSSFDESNPRYAYNANIQAIDVKSKEFLQLPADVRHEILVDIKETRKQSSWGRLHELPAKSDDFSTFQMKRLLKRRDVQVSLQTAEQEMGGRSLTYAELTDIFSEQGILATDVVELGTKRIISDEHTRFLLVKDLKKKLEKAKEEVKQEKQETKAEKPQRELSSAENLDSPSKNQKDTKKLGNENFADLELALALSLENDTNRVYDEKDYEYDLDENLKLSKGQRQQLQNAAKGPARTYMIEYAGMNAEEVKGILEKTQANDTLNIEALLSDTCEKEPKDGGLIEDVTEKPTPHTESQEIRLCVTDDSDETDSDLEEVEIIEEKTSKNIKSVELNTKSNEIEEIIDSDATVTDFEEVEDVDSQEIKINIKSLNLQEEECVIEETPPCLADEGDDVKIVSSKNLKIQIDLTKPLEPDDDLFADVFKDIKPKEEVLDNNFVNLEQNASLVSKEKKILEHSSINESSKESKENDNLPTLKIKTPPKTIQILSILDELKKQAEEIKNIKLENIKLDEAIIEISDDEPALLGHTVIEVCDSDDNAKRPSTPTNQINSSMQSPKLNSRSPNLKTPSKNQTITEFFNVNYVVKRTPDKPLPTENELTPKVKSPFFVRKTPKSDRKINSNSPSADKNPSKVNKSLFKQGKESPAKDSYDELQNDFIPLQETKPLSQQEVLNEAAKVLKAQKTDEELNSIATGLAKERKELENERNRQDRMGMSITHRMNSDCQDLLRLFGIPFVVAPMEAEAQCAFLDMIQLTNGTITDDSDIWLFGGRTVYKNFFAQNKHVMEFRSEQIEKDFSCDRKKLIQLACLVGSDYTTGIHGIGAVTALEILASFTPKESMNKNDETVYKSTQTLLDTLQRFRNWWQTFKTTVAPPGSSARLALQKKLKNIEIYEGFPSTAVVEAYLTPKVDENKDAFSWGYPDVESIKEFARKSFGWTTSKTDDILGPVLKKLNEKRTQQSIRNYFNVKNALSLKQIRVSKRVQTAIEKMSGNIDSDESSEKPTKAKRIKKTKSSSARQKKAAPPAAVDMEVKEVNELSSIAEASCTSQTAKGPLSRPVKRVNIPETKQIIPQREKDLAQMEANKKLAAEILKNAAKNTKKKRRT